MTIRLAPYARLGEIVTLRAVDLQSGATAGRAWDVLCERHADLRLLQGATRLVVNGAFAHADTVLHEGDELALLPPFGGG